MTAKGDKREPSFCAWIRWRGGRKVGDTVQFGAAAFNSCSIHDPRTGARPGVVGDLTTCVR